MSYCTQDREGMADSYPEVGIPGFEVIDSQEVVNNSQWSLKGCFSGFLFELIISKKAIGGNYLVTQVCRADADHRVLWSFKDCLPGSKAMLLYSGLIKDAVIATVSNDWRILEVLPVSLIPTALKVANVGGEGFSWRSPQSLEEIVRLKKELGQAYGFECELAPAEKIAEKRMDETAHSVALSFIEKMGAERAAMLEGKREARLAKRTEIMDRPKMEIWTREGRRLLAVPVDDSEWPFLAEGTRCVIDIGGALKCFLVFRGTNGNLAKELVEQVFARNPVVFADPFILMPAKERVFEIEGQLRQLPVLDMVEAEECVPSLPEGAMVAVAIPGADRGYAVFRKKDGSIKEFSGEFYPIG